MIDGIPGAMHSPIILATFCNQPESVRTLLDASASPHVRSPYGGGTALHKAASYGYTNIIELLISEGRADPNAIDNEHRTPLHCAAAEGHVNAVETLLRAKADLWATTKMNQSVLAIARDRKQDRVVELLLAKLHEPVQAGSDETKLQREASSSSPSLESTTHSAPDDTSEVGEARIGAPKRVNSSFREPPIAYDPISPAHSVKRLTLAATDADLQGLLSSTDSLPVTPPEKERSSSVVSLPRPPTPALPVSPAPEEHDESAEPTETTEPTDPSPGADGQTGTANGEGVAREGRAASTSGTGPRVPTYRLQDFRFEEVPDSSPPSSPRSSNRLGCVCT